MPDALPSIPLSTHFTRQQYLYAFAGQGELANYIRTQAIPEERQRLPEIVAAWHSVQERVRSLGTAFGPKQLRVCRLAA